MTCRKELEKIMNELRVEQKEAKADKFGFSSKGNSILTINAQLCHYNSMYKAFNGKRYRGKKND